MAKLVLYGEFPMSDEPVTISHPYEIVSVEKTDPPSGTEGSDWYHYVIAQGPNIIRGYRQGALSAVKIAVAEVVEQLNQRRFGKRARVNLITVPKKTKS
tara:strand:- start:191 stop:487 length:297 start_codon:yes stop_codon:yes gene_type:complete